MTPDVHPAAVDRSRPSLRSIVAVPFRTQTYKNLLYLWLAFPLGMAYFVGFTVAFSVSAALVVLLVGVPMLVLCLLLVTLTGGLERVLSRWLLATDIPDPSREYLGEERLLTGVVGLVTDPTTWTSLVYLVTKFVFGVISFVLVFVSFVTSLVLIATPTYYQQPDVNVGIVTSEPIRLTPSVSLAWDDLFVGVDTVVQITSWQVDTLPEALAMSVLGVFVLLLGLNLTNGLAWLWGKYSRVMLGPDPVGTLRSVAGR